jgi:hypothetical protein
MSSLEDVFLSIAKSVGAKDGSGGMVHYSLYSLLPLLTTPSTQYSLYSPLPLHLYADAPT